MTMPTDHDADELKRLGEEMVRKGNELADSLRGSPGIDFMRKAQLDDWRDAREAFERAIGGRVH